MQVATEVHIANDVDLHHGRITLLYFNIVLFVESKLATLWCLRVPILSLVVRWSLTRSCVRESESKSDLDSRGPACYIYWG
jgi:hypothetical protein